MSLIRTTKHYPAFGQSDRHIILLCGFGGRVWQNLRLIRLMRQAGYHVTALDFHKTVLSSGDPTLLPQLVREVHAFAEAEATRLGRPPLLVGISLGALIALNIVRRSTTFRQAVLVTGGDIVKVAQKIYRHVWPTTYDELAHEWREVNMYSEPASLAGKRLLFVLPTKDKQVDPADVYEEVARQRAAGNEIELLERTRFGHLGTIIYETIWRPRTIIEYVRRFEP